MKNYSRAIFLISDDVRCVECTYESDEDAARTQFKTFDETVVVGDLVIVPTKTRHNMTVCKVVAIDVEPDLETSAHMDWLVGTVNHADFDSITAQEKDAIDRIKAAEKRRKKAELRETLLADAKDEIKALPIYTAKNGEAD